MVLIVAFLLAFLGSAVAHAEGPKLVDKEKKPGRFGLTLHSGYTTGLIRHPYYTERQMHAALWGLDIGFTLNRYAFLGFQASSTAMSVKEIDLHEYARKNKEIENENENPSQPVLRLPCEEGQCEDAKGGREVAHAMSTFIVGPYVEVTPMGRNGFYCGLTGGLGAILLERSDTGGAASVRGGYRYYFGKIIAASLSLGLQGIITDEARAWLPFLIAEIHLHSLSR